MARKGVLLPQAVSFSTSCPTAPTPNAASSIPSSSSVQVLALSTSTPFAALHKYGNYYVLQTVDLVAGPVGVASLDARSVFLVKRGALMEA